MKRTGVAQFTYCCDDVFLKEFKGLRRALKTSGCTLRIFDEAKGVWDRPLPRPNSRKKHACKYCQDYFHRTRVTVTYEIPDLQPSRKILR